MTGRRFAFQKVLVANRGEIACRVIDTLHRCGLQSVAVHHRLDHRARHAMVAGEVYQLAGETPVAAHLDTDQIIDIARKSGAEAVHPGYGFLSENAKFACAVQAAGLAFIGPDPDSISLMGDKIESRLFAEKHGVPVAPSVTLTGDLPAFVDAASSIGFPLLIKAAAGGGGKGMSIVRNREEMAERARLAAGEAERYFSDSRIYAERYIEQPRHIEVQVFGDGKGQAIHLFERECSVQRRFQKVIEEAPSVGLPDQLRQRICNAAVMLTRAAHYKNAGTVEFVLAPDGQFYFLEMNTRLQVEHPITEMITGLDLVEMQLAIASGESLPPQESIKLAGHAIECRICAENPEQNFMPEVGRVLHLAIAEGEGVRFDSGLMIGQQVTANFDPMLAKLITHGTTRANAIDKVRDALHATAVLGVTTNVDYLARVVDHAEFRRGALHTGFLLEHAEALKAALMTVEDKALAILAAAMASADLRRQLFASPEPYGAMAGWRN